jgi:lysozyme
MINQRTIDLIKEFEGCELKAYKDAVGVWTIGYGHTSAAGMPMVLPGMTITKQQAEDILRLDLQKYEGYVKNAVRTDVNENQYGALVSFVYNLGNGNLRSSTLLRKVNARDFTGAAQNSLNGIKLVEKNSKV